MLQTTSDNDLGGQASRNNENQDVTAGAGGAISDGGVDRSIKNLSTAIISAKSKNPKLTKPKKSDLVKTQNFAKTNFFGMDFLTPGVKKAFIHLRKAFIKTPILRYFNLECHIRIEIDIVGYAIGEVLS